jgi:hypothetical protein
LWSDVASRCEKHLHISNPIQILPLSSTVLSWA